MKTNKYILGKLIVALGMLIVTSACNPSPNISATPTPTIKPTSTIKITPTVTPSPTITIGNSNLPSPSSNQCEGLSGELEMQVLVGPADAVGLEPVAIGSIPFTVITEGDTFAVEGNGAIAYQETLEKEWGTYTVEFDLEAVIDGDCQGDEQIGVLNMIVETSGEQFVEISSEGYQGEFPWAGSQEFELSFPIEEGAAAEGEGWTFLLHLNK
jgi:hypothetical protein